MVNLHPEILEVLIGEELSSVVFVQDYVQLDFNGLRLTAFVWPIVMEPSGAFEFGMLEYRNKLCERIAKAVANTEIRVDDGIFLYFADGGTLKIPIDVGAYTNGPEAAMFMTNRSGEPGPWMVW